MLELWKFEGFESVNGNLSKIMCLERFIYYFIAECSFTLKKNKKGETYRRVEHKCIFIVLPIFILDRLLIESLL